jgi:hypothetical protein
MAPGRRERASCLRPRKNARRRGGATMGVPLLLTPYLRLLRFGRNLQAARLSEEPNEFSRRRFEPATFGL